MSANEYQVAGNHYGGLEFQHWDLCAACPLDYFAGNSTKYVTRWRHKGGKQDLLKALHYLSKMEEAQVQPPVRKLTSSGLLHMVDAFAAANKLSDLEHAYVRCLSTWQLPEDLQGARELLFLLLDEAEALETGAIPVPLCEENHYSERVGQEPNVD